MDPSRDNTPARRSTRTPARVLVVASLLLVSCSAATEVPPPPPVVTGRAGEVTHLRPAAFSEQDKQPTVELAAGTGVEWQSLVRTEPSGRVRPVFPFWEREHPVNMVLGRLRHKILGPVGGKKAKPKAARKKKQ